MDCADSRGSSFHIFYVWLLSESLFIFLQTHVTLKRIAVYLDEDEVTDQVSSLKKDYSEPYLSGGDEGLGLECATFRWNEVVEAMKKGKQLDHKKGKQLDHKKSSSSSTSSLETDEASTVVDAESINDRVFELRNMTIRFPEGQLTVVTGPTASGKTALLVSSYIPFISFQR